MQLTKEKRAVSIFFALGNTEVNSFCLVCTEFTGDTSTEFTIPPTTPDKGESCCWGLKMISHHQNSCEILRM